MTKKALIIMLLFTIPLVIIAGAIGFYSSSNKKLPVQDEQTAPTKKLTPIPVANWKTYQTKDFSFQYPADWKISTSEAKLSVGTFKTETITNVTLPDVLPSGSASATPVMPPEGGAIIIQNDPIATSAASRFPSSVYTPDAKLQINSVETQTYKLKQQGAVMSYLIIPYKQYTLSFDYYNYQHPDWNYPALFDQIIKSISLINEK